MPFRKSVNLDSLAARGDEQGLRKALRPVRADFFEDREGNVGDVGWRRRADAARLLGASGSPESGEALLNALSDVSPDVRREALAALARRDDQAEEDMVAAVLTWPEPGVRDDAEKVLARCARADSAAASRMVDAYAAAEGGEALSDEWVEVVAGAMPAAERRRVIVEAARAAVSDPGAVRCVQILRSDPRESAGVLRAGAESGRDALGWIRVLGETRLDTATEPLVRLLGDADPALRSAAATALEHVRDPHAIEALLRTTADPEYEVRDAALRTLDAFGTAAIVWGLAAAGRGVLDDMVEVAERWTASPPLGPARARELAPAADVESSAVDASDELPRRAVTGGARAAGSVRRPRPGLLG